MKTKVKPTEELIKAEALFALTKTIIGAPLGAIFGKYFSNSFWICIGWILSVVILICLSIFAKKFTILSQHSLKTLCLRHGTFSYFITILLFWGIGYSYL